MFVIIVGCGRVGAELAFRLFERGIRSRSSTRWGPPSNIWTPTIAGARSRPRCWTRTCSCAPASSRRTAWPRSPTPTPSTPWWATWRAPSSTSRTSWSATTIPRWRPLHEAFGLQMVSSTAWGAQRIEEMPARSPVPQRLLGRQRRGRGLRAAWSPEAWEGADAPGLHRVRGVRAGGPHPRRPRVCCPRRRRRSQAGDVVHVSATLAGIEALRRRLEGKEA